MTSSLIVFIDDRPLLGTYQALMVQLWSDFDSRWLALIARILDADTVDNDL